MPEWDPEIEIDAAAAKRLIGAQFPQLAGSDVTDLAVGWDNSVFLVDGRWAFRFPRRQIVVAGVEREIEVLGRLAPNVPLPIPAPRWVGAPSEDYPWPWFGAEYLPGVELADAGLPDDARANLGAALGGFLRALHAPMLRSRIGPSLAVDPMRRADMPYRVAATRRRLQQLAEAGLWQPLDAVARLLDDADSLPPSPRMVVLHGDLHVRHVLVAEDGRATGVIDWDDVCLGDPSADLSIGFAAFQGDARSAFVEAYGGALEGLTELRARVIAVFLAASLLAYADDRGNASLAREASRGLERAVAG